MKINKNNWQEFKFNDIFTIVRGKRLVKIDQIIGNIAYISASKQNNGIDNYILPPDFMKIHQNALTLSNSGSVGCCFYHPYKFVVSDHCTVIQIKDKNITLNNYISLFLKPIIELMKNKYNFAREINNDRLKKEKILLPVKNNKNPDWYFMENYIKDLSKNIKYIKNMTKKIDFLDIKNTNIKWKEFKLKKIFKLFLGKPTHSIEIEGIKSSSTDGIPYITRTAKNNGIEAFVDKSVVNPNKIIKGNCITIGAEGFKAFYQVNDFMTGNKVNILRNKKLNLWNSLFINSILNLIIIEKFGYGRGLVKSRLENLNIKLPIDKNKVPNWQFMEKYIKTLPYSSNLK